MDDKWLVIIAMGMAAMNVILLRNAFEGVPSEIEEAAIVDGATEFQVLSKVYIPMSKSTIATVALFFGISTHSSSGEREGETILPCSMVMSFISSISWDPQRRRSPRPVRCTALPHPAVPVRPHLRFPASVARFLQPEVKFHLPWLPMRSGRP